MILTALDLWANKIASTPIKLRLAAVFVITIQLSSLLFYHSKFPRGEPFEVATGIVQGSSLTPRLRPYSTFCETVVMNEKQKWNPRKKIISYALFSGNKQGTLDDWLMSGIRHNIQGAALYYPDWIVRVHVVGVSQDTIRNILDVSDSVEVVECHQSSPLNRSSSHKMVSRFLPYDDPTVFYTIVRDLDSRFSPRELLAVNEWMSSDQLFHTMRDHQYHMHPIMGGMFGMKRGCLGSDSSPTTTVTYLISKAMREQPDEILGSCQGYDQCFLEEYVWPRVKQNAMDHDFVTSRCQRYGSAVCKPWPLGKRNEATNHFVGAMFKTDRRFPSSTPGYSCEMQCQPE